MIKSSKRDYTSLLKDVRLRVDYLQDNIKIALRMISEALFWRVSVI